MSCSGSKLCRKAARHAKETRRTDLEARSGFMKFGTGRYLHSALNATHTTESMPPRTRNKEESRKEAVEERPTVADLEGESSFATLARKLWLNKRTAKVKVKHDVLKTEIWDVLEKEDFSFKSLLVLENLQILERYAHSIPLLLKSLTWKPATFGQAIPRTHPIFTSCL